jgi:hypothetical protein
MLVIKKVINWIVGETPNAQIDDTMPVVANVLHNAQANKFTQQIE